MQGPVLRREDERHRLVEGAVLPQELVEIRAVVGTEARPEDEEVVSRDDVGGVELEIADVLRGLEERARCGPYRAVEKLPVYRQAPRLGEGDPVGGYATGT
jgi:hypothetical protein